MPDRLKPMPRARLPRLAATLLLAAAAGLAHAKDAPPAAEDPVLEAKLQAIAGELRCLVCQNETIAASNADLAVDLRRQVRQMLREGKSEREIIDYMTARYGDFVLYSPPFKTTTALLWLGPALLLLIGGAVLGRHLARRREQQAVKPLTQAESARAQALLAGEGKDGRA